MEGNHISMSEKKLSPIFRLPIILLALANLAVLGAILWPWQDVARLPGNGATGIDPAVSLVGYIGLTFWIGSARTEFARKFLFTSGLLGLIGGLVLTGYVYLATQPISPDGKQSSTEQYALITGTIVVWAVVAFRAARKGGSTGFASLCATWSAMVSSSLASLALLGAFFYSRTPGQTTDMWKQYQGLAIGSEETQALVHTLLTATGFLLIGPIVACIAGAIVGSMAKPAKS